MSALPFVLVTLLLCVVFEIVRHLAPWTVMSVAGWAVTGWVIMAVVASVLGLLRA